jgi:hypothetical protein
MEAGPVGEARVPPTPEFELEEAAAGLGPRGLEPTGGLTEGCAALQLAGESIVGVEWPERATPERASVAAAFEDRMEAGDERVSEVETTAEGTIINAATATTIPINNTFFGCISSPGCPSREVRVALPYNR